MPDNAPEKKPTIVVAPDELVAIYDRLHEREWNKETGAYKNPVNVMRYVLHYGRVAAARLVDAFGRLAALEGRQAALEGRLAGLEEFRRKVEDQTAEAMKQIEAMGAMDDAPPEIKQMMEAAKVALVPPGDAPPADAPAPKPDAAVLPIKPKAGKNKTDSGAPGGAAS